MFFFVENLLKHLIHINFFKNQLSNFTRLEMDVNENDRKIYIYTMEN